MVQRKKDNHYVWLDEPSVQKALTWAQEHNAQEAVLTQGKIMADILHDLNMDAHSLAAAIILPVVNALKINQEQIAADFSPQMAKLIYGVQQMDAIQAISSLQHQDGLQLDNLRRMLLAMVEDVRVVIIKLAERVYMMRTLKDKDPETQIATATQTMNIYAPLANRLGVGQIKWELEDLAFRYLQPDAYKNIARLLDEKRLQREAYIEDILNTLDAALKDDSIDAQVEGRVKHIYSIWRKMQKKHLDYHQIYDVRALRIMVPEIKDCYAALGTVHRLWQPISSEFDDYIARPKENGYRSLHTAVIGPEGKAVEVQIRTHKMHEESELGVASHWRYKEGVKHDAGYEQKLAWLRELLEWQEEADLPSQFVDEHIYALTPKGDIVDLPVNATPLDFAYHVHTSVGHRCRGAKVNMHMVPLTYKLKTGDQVEILTAKENKPSRDWLNPELGYAVSSRTRQKIQAWFRQQNREHNIATGKALVEKESERLMLKPFNYDQLAEKFNFKTGDEILAAIGRGDLSFAQLLNAAGISLQSLTPSRAPKLSVIKSNTANITISGVGNLLTQLAKCCHPVPGDPIIGYVTIGRGVTIHRKDCSNIYDYEEHHKERLVQVDWEQSHSTRTYGVEIHVDAIDRPNLLRDITNMLSTEKITLSALQTHAQALQHTIRLDMILQISDISTLSRLLDRMNSIPNVINASRYQNAKNRS
ncbi:MAG: GTP diphosphokinase [Gammaproteobacteria bacterium]|jgi:GTP pyrophosphokinase